MDTVIVERKPDEQRIHSEHVLEVRNDRDGAACSHGYSLVAPFIGENGPRFCQRRIVERKLDCRSEAKIAEFDLAVGGQARAHERAESIADFSGFCSPTRRKETFALASPGMTVFAPSPV